MQTSKNPWVRCRCPFEAPIMLIKEQKQYHPLARRVKNSISLNLRCIALHLRYRVEEWEAYKIVFFTTRREQFCAKILWILASYMQSQAALGEVCAPHGWHPSPRAACDCMYGSWIPAF